MPVVSMTEVTLRHLKAPAKGAAIYVDQGLKGFGVRVTANGAQSYVLTYGEERKRITIGDTNILRLAEARAKAKNFLAELQLGKLAKPPAKLFEELARQFLQIHCRQNNKASTADETERLLFRHFIPALASRPVDSLQTADIMGIVDSLMKTPSEANHAFTAVKTFLNWLVGRGHIDRNPVQALKKPAKARSRNRVLSDAELRCVLNHSRQRGQYGQIVELLILTGQRLGQIVSLRGEFFDRQAQTISWPAALMKANREHVIPIGNRAAELLVGLADSGLLFSTREGRPFNNWSSTKRGLDALIETKAEPWTLHDLRRTFATIHARLGTPPHVVERMLAHMSGTISGVAAIYNRHSYLDEMRAAMTAYEACIAKLIKG